MAYLTPGPWTLVLIEGSLKGEGGTCQPSDVLVLFPWIKTPLPAYPRNSRGPDGVSGEGKSTDHSTLTTIE